MSYVLLCLDVGDLRKTNALAVNNSCHCYGTTFDISYTLFESLSLGKTMAAEDIKKVLGEVLTDQKRAGNIFVKHEVNQRASTLLRDININKLSQLL